MKPFLIIFNVSRGNRDKFFEIVCENEIQVTTIIRRKEEASDNHPAYDCYTANVICSQESIRLMENTLTGFAWGISNGDISFSDT